MKKIKKCISLPLMLALFLLTGYTIEDDTNHVDPVDKLNESIKIIEDLASAENKGLPISMIQKSEGIVIVPEIVKAGFIFGGKHGKGIALIKDENGQWSNPIWVKLTGGSFGWQIGVQKIELILVFKDRDNIKSITDGEFEIGGDASATAGPVGRSASAGTNVKMEAEIYSYSKSKGLFAGISVNGSKLSMDDKRNDEFYGIEDVAAEDIFSNSVSAHEATIANLKSALNNLE